MSNSPFEREYDPDEYKQNKPDWVEDRSIGPNPHEYSHQIVPNRLHKFLIKPDDMDQETFREYVGDMGTFFGQYLSDEVPSRAPWNSLDDIPEWFYEYFEGRDDLVPATKYKYRAAARCMLWGLGVPEEIMTEFEQYDFSFNDRTKSDNTKRNRQVKRTFKKDAMRTVLDSFVKRSTNDNNIYAKYLLDWLPVALWTGVRPSEWEDARVDSEYEVLIVPNGKQQLTDGTFGESRRLFLNFTDEQKKRLRRHLNRVSNYGRSDEEKILFDRILGSAQNQLRRVVRDVLDSDDGIYPSLYSCRHQFCANAKASEFSEIEIAAMMGHRSFRTQKSYGYSVAGSDGRFPVKPDPDLVQQMGFKFTGRL